MQTSIQPREPLCSPLDTVVLEGLSLQSPCMGLRLQSGHRAVHHCLVVMIDPQAHTTGAGSADGCGEGTSPCLAKNRRLCVI